MCYLKECIMKHITLIYGSIQKKSTRHIEANVNT
jgi:hypothetical protein